MQNLATQLNKLAKHLSTFKQIIELRARCKGVNCVDLVESFPTSICLQNLAPIGPIQPRTDRFHFFNLDPAPVLICLEVPHPALISVGSRRMRPFGILIGTESSVLLHVVKRILTCSQVTCLKNISTLVLNHTYPSCSNVLQICFLHIA